VLAKLMPKTGFDNPHMLIWIPVLLGLIAMYGPTYYAVSQTFWTESDQAHGPIVLLVVCFLFWQHRHLFLQEPDSTHGSNVGWVFLVIGLVCYLVGRSQDILILDLGSQIPVLMGVILISRGARVLKQLWFPLFFIVFMLPLPLDSITMPMKMAVSYVTENILYAFDFPIARSGVILQIGQYQLLVADACAGMHTLISLEALGLLYLNLVKHDSWLRNILLAVLIIPISFTANVIRVIALTLITYYFGDEVGQGFVHGFAGMLLFVVALVFILSIDNLIQYFIKRRGLVNA